MRSCTTRETREETGVEVDVGRCLFVYEIVGPVRASRRVELVFAATRRGAAPRLLRTDRQPLGRMATHILAWEGRPGKWASWFWFEGNFADYEKNKVDRLGTEAARPHRVTHRRLRRGR